VFLAAKWLGVRSYFGQDGRRGWLPNARNRPQQFPLPVVTSLVDLLADRPIEVKNLVYQKTQVLQAEVNHHPMVVAHLVLLERGHDLGNLLLRPPLGALGDLSRIHLAFQQGLQHQLTGRPKNVRKHIPQLYIRVFQYLLHPVLFARRGLNHLLAPARQIPQFSLCILSVRPAG